MKIDHQRDRGVLGPEPAPLDREPVQRPVEDVDAWTGQQLIDLDDAQLAAAHPGSDRLLMGQQHLPRVAVAIGPGRPHRADQLIGQRLRTAVASQPSLVSSLHVPAGGLAVYPPARAATVPSPTPAN